MNYESAHSAVQKKEILPSATTWMQPDNTRPIEASQTEEDTHSMR